MHYSVQRKGGAKCVVTLHAHDDRTSQTTTGFWRFSLFSVLLSVLLHDVIWEPVLLHCTPSIAKGTMEIIAGLLSRLECNDEAFVARLQVFASRLPTAGLVLAFILFARVLARRSLVVAELVSLERAGGSSGKGCVRLSTLYADGNERVVRCIDAALVDSVVINEAIQRQRVLTYLVLLIAKHRQIATPGDQAPEEEELKQLQERPKRQWLSADALEGELTVAIGRELRPPVRLLAEIYRVLDHEISLLSS